MRTLLAITIAAVAGAWSPGPRCAIASNGAAHARRSAVRTPPPHAEVAAEEPFRSDDSFDYFRRSKQVSVTLTKPLGAMLEEVSGVGGVRVEGLQEGGSALESGLLKKGDRLLSVLGTDVSKSDFESVMELLIAAPDEVELDVSRTVIVKRPREVKPDPTLTVKDADGAEVSGDVAKGSSLRLTIQGSGVELYKGMNKLTQCGGAGQCNTCKVNVLAGADNLSPRTEVELRRLKKSPPNTRLACQALINGDVTVEVP